MPQRPVTLQDYESQLKGTGGGKSAYTIAGEEMEEFTNHSLLQSGSIVVGMLEWALRNL